jgi:glycine betaine/proline transport system permease protein
MQWLEAYKIPIGKWAEKCVDWLSENAGWLFDAIEVFLNTIISSLLTILQYPPNYIIIALICAVTYFLQRSLALTAAILLGLLFIVNQGYWEGTTETLSLVLASTFVCMALGVPSGIFLAHRPRLYKCCQPILDLMQTLPSFVYLIPAIIFFGLGLVPGLVATVVFVIPAPIRLTQLGISSTPEEMLEAGDAFGATKFQKLITIELPSSMPQIMAGLTQTIMLSLSMVVIAALVGADGLGVPVLRALNTVNTALGFEAGFVIVVLAIMLDRIMRQRKHQK